MGTDEAGTHARVKALHEGFIEPLVAEHRGRVVKTAGDGFLCEFASVVDAVECALAWQAGVAEQETVEAEERRFRFRIGINVSDVIVDGDDLFGDGVNIAARLEALADTGSIFISSDAYRQVKGKVDAAFEDLGDRELKNIPEPVRIYRVGPPGADTTTSAPRATPPLKLPSKPSIAVLPFANRSGDPEQEYFPTALPRTSSRRCLGFVGSSSSPAIPVSATRARRTMPSRWLANSAFDTCWREACAGRETGCE